MRKPLFEDCPICTAGKVTTENLGVIDCPVCHVRRVVPVGLTVGQVDALQAVRAALERSGFDLSPCLTCGEPVVCIPDGLPMCEPCAEGEG